MMYPNFRVPVIDLLKGQIAPQAITAWGFARVVDVGGAAVRVVAVAVGTIAAVSETDTAPAGVEPNRNVDS
jgi:hypothetical protein